MRIKRIFVLVLLCLMLPACCLAFSDTKGHWAEDSISELSAKGIMTGTEIGFLPDREITRAQFVTAVIRAIGRETNGGKTDFSDVSANSVYAPYIASAYEAGIISGYEDGTFRPERPLSREEAAVVLSRAFGYLSGYSNARKYSDFSAITEGARSAVSYAVHEGILSGYPDGTMRPRGNVTRAESAVMISASMKLEQNEPGFVIGYPRVSASGKKGYITLDITTNIPCNIYYSAYGSEMPGIPSKETVRTHLTSITEGNRQQTVTIKGEIGKLYNIYLVAETPDGMSSKVVSVDKASPLPFGEGAGTRANPYAVYTAEELGLIRHFPDKEYIIKRDITLSGEWTPIENFEGVLDGDGHRIDGLYVDKDGGYAGLFAKIKKGEVKNLTVTGQVSGNKNAGILAGEILDAKISHIVTAGRVSAATNNAGGIAGENAGIIENSLSAVYLVESGSFSGGVAGQNYGIIRNTISAAHTVTSNMYAGGIASVNMGGRIESSVSASVNVWNSMQINCGRVATAKADSVLYNNAAYEDMRTNSLTDINMSDNDNGADITWDELIDRKTLCALMGWNESEWNGGGRNEKYLIPHPQGTSVPELIAGICEYSPVRVSNAAELLSMIDNPDMHYMLTKSIRFSDNLRWTPASDSELYDEGFSGTLDGGGYAIYNIKIDASERTGLSGMFGTISTGTVRNLKLINPVIEAGDITGIFAAVNYGRLSGCTASGISVNAEGEAFYIGGIAGYNYGAITSAEAEGTISANCINNVIGGIAAHNEGFINDVSYKGSINATSDGSNESVAAGICGYNGQGYIYNAYSAVNLRQKATTIYGGGICGIQESGEVYKCSSDGTLLSESPMGRKSTSYLGGVCALSSNSLIMNAFSTANITQHSDKNYAGGIAGYNETGIIQNTYSTSAIKQLPDSYALEYYESFAGGIAAINEQGQVVQNLAINREIVPAGKAGRIVAGGTADLTVNNFASELDLPSAEEKEFDGETLAKTRITYNYITLPASAGGALGFSQEIWTAPKTRHYTLPVLRGVKYQENFMTD